MLLTLILAIAFIAIIIPIPIPSAWDPQSVGGQTGRGDRSEALGDEVAGATRNRRPPEPKATTGKRRAARPWGRARLRAAWPLCDHNMDVLTDQPSIK